MVARAQQRENAVQSYFRPFFRTKSGHIFTLCAPHGHMRDGLAAAQIARYFPLPEYAGISIVPGHPGSTPDANIILVGWSKLFVDLHKPPGGKRLFSKLLKTRIEGIMKQCCFEFRKGRQAAMVNRVSGARFTAQAGVREGIKVDYGVIRRLCRSATENTVIVEGLHWLGTLGAAKVLTQASLLEDIWQKRSKLGDVRDSAPLEILVRAEFDPQIRDGVHALEAIQATPLLAVHDRDWVMDLVDDGDWVDQRPWEATLVAREEGSAMLVGPGARLPLPRLEIHLDLGEMDRRVRDPARKLLVDATGGSLPVPDRDRAGRRQVSRLLEKLTLASDQSRLLMIGLSKRDSSIHETVLPEGGSKAHHLRKRLLLHLSLRRILGSVFCNDEESVRRFFPELAEAAGRTKVTDYFTKRLTSRLGEGLQAVFGDGSQRNKKDYARIEKNPRKRSFALHLERMALVVKVRVTPSR